MLAHMHTKHMQIGTIITDHFVRVCTGTIIVLIPLLMLFLQRRWRKGILLTQ